MCNLYVYLCKLGEWYWRDSGVLGVLTLKCMVFNCSLTFEFGYPHTLVQMDPAKGAGPLYGIPVVWDTRKREQSKYHTSRG